MVEKVGGTKPIPKKDGGATLPLFRRIFSVAPSAPQKPLFDASRRNDWGGITQFRNLPQSSVWEGAIALLALPYVCPRNKVVLGPKVAEFNRILLSF